MRKITLLTLLLIASYGVFSQSTHTVEYFNWSNPNTFNLSPSPVITGYGFYSDSLSEVFDDKTFYEYNNEYYCIGDWWDSKIHEEKYVGILPCKLFQHVEDRLSNRVDKLLHMTSSPYGEIGRRASLKM